MTLLLTFILLFDVNIYLDDADICVSGIKSVDVDVCVGVHVEVAYVSVHVAVHVDATFSGY